MSTQAELQKFAMGCITGIVIFAAALSGLSAIVGIRWKPVKIGRDGATAMGERINKLYKPYELAAAVAVLQENKFHDFHEDDARAVVMALHKLGYRIVYAGKVEEPKQ